jgi:hypothetical protein
MRLFICIIFLALLTGCPQKNTTLVLTHDPAAAAKQIQNLIPVGTASTNAEFIMHQQGFECSIKHGDFLDGSNVVKNADYIYCDKSVTEGWPVQRRYQVALVLTNDRISAVKLSTGLVGP